MSLRLNNDMFKAATIGEQTPFGNCNRDEPENPESPLRSYCRGSDDCDWCLVAWRPPATHTPLTLPRLPCHFSEPTASVPPQSDVYRMLHNSQDEPTKPRQSGSFRVLQELVNDGEWLGRLRTVIGRACWQARGRGGQQTGWEWKSKYGFYSEIK